MLYTKFRLTLAIQELLSELSAAREELDAYRVVPGAIWPELRRHIIAASVHSSTGIEGNTLTLEQVETLLREEHVSAPQDQIQEALNYYEAMQYVRGIGTASSPRFNHDTIKAIHYNVTKSLPGDYNPGHYREGQNNVEDRTTGHKIYRPPPGECVQALMDEYVRWFTAPVRGLHPYCKAALSHLNFVAIHPFYNGNGRTARIIDTLVLYMAGYKSPDIVSLEEYFGRYSQSYYRTMQTAIGDTYNPAVHDVTPWVEYYLRAYLTQAKAALVEREKLKAGAHALMSKYSLQLMLPLKLRRKDMLLVFDWKTAYKPYVIRGVALVAACNSGLTTSSVLRRSAGDVGIEVSNRTIARHLAWLVNAGLLVRRREGSATEYVPSEEVAQVFEKASTAPVSSPR